MLADVRPCAKNAHMRGECQTCVPALTEQSVGPAGINKNEPSITKMRRLTYSCDKVPSGLSDTTLITPEVHGSV